MEAVSPLAQTRSTPGGHSPTQRRVASQQHSHKHTPSCLTSICVVYLLCFESHDHGRRRNMKTRNLTGKQVEQKLANRIDQTHKGEIREQVCLRLNDWDTHWELILDDGSNEWRPVQQKESEKEDTRKPGEGGCSGLPLPLPPPGRIIFNPANRKLVTTS